MLTLTLCYAPLLIMPAGALFIVLTDWTPRPGRYAQHREAVKRANRASTGYAYSGGAR